MGLQVEFSELRIGNILRIDGALSVVEEIKKDGLSYHLVPNETFLHQPSLGFQSEPLTEEWLVKLGFHWDLERESLLIGIDGILYISFYKINDGINEVAQLCTINGDYTTGIDINHIHQLQNLYFALTGTELVCKSL